MEAIEVAYADTREIQKLSTSKVAETLEIESKNRKIQTLKDEISRASQTLEEFRKGDAWQSLQSLQEESTEVGTGSRKPKQV